MIRKHYFRKSLAAVLAAATIATSGAGAVTVNAASAGQRYGIHVETGYLALRTAASYDAANEIGKLKNKDSLIVIDKSDPTYWYVYSPKYKTYGYVNANYIYKKGSSSGTQAANEYVNKEIKKASKKANKKAAKKSGEEYKVSVQYGYLALRTDPSYTGAPYRTAKEIGKLYNSESVIVIDKSDSTYWYVYSSKLNLYGYVNANYLKEKSCKEVETTQETTKETISDSTKEYLSLSKKKTGEKYKVFLLNGYLALRSAPAYSFSNELAELYTGLNVKVIDKNYGPYWYVYVPVFDMHGFVNKDYLTKM